MSAASVAEIQMQAIPAYLIANATFGYEEPQWGIDLNIHNFTNQRYFIAANGAGAYVGQPLSVFLNLHANL